MNGTAVGETRPTVRYGANSRDVPGLRLVFVTPFVSFCLFAAGPSSVSSTSMVSSVQALSTQLTKIGLILRTMAALDPLSRTPSAESTGSQSSSHYLSNAATTARKGRQADIETTSGSVDPASISMPPPASKLNLRYQNMDPRTLDAGYLTSSTGPPSLRATSSQDSEEHAPNLLAPSSVPEDSTMRKSDPEIDIKRLSFSSLPLYNLGRSAPSSVAGGSDQDC